MADRGADFDVLRVNQEMVAERERIAAYLSAPPDKTLALVAQMDFTEPDEAAEIHHTCPMHPEVAQKGPGKCPICGITLMPSRGGAGAEGADAVGEHEQGVGREHGGGHGHGHHHEEADPLEDGIEWEDLMPEVNRETTAATMRWKVVDRETGRENAGIEWELDTGEQVKVRIVNERESDHPMHHPFHVHGERFLVLARNGSPEPNLVWKDTVLIPTGQTVDLLLDASNPGRWMAHCHIAEHLEVGMMFDFLVR